jgi:hypothetical protein
VAEGLTVILVPLPMEVPPQLFSYHLHDALLPKLPPFTRSVTDEPKQMESAVDMMLTAGTEKLFTLIVLLAHIVVLQVPSIRAK